MDGKYSCLYRNFQSRFPFLKAPEVIQQKDPNCYSTSSDVYAYGCVLFEMFSGKLPHAPVSNKEQVSFTKPESYIGIHRPLESPERPVVSTFLLIRTELSEQISFRN